MQAINSWKAMTAYKQTFCRLKQVKLCRYLIKRKFVAQSYFHRLGQDPLVYRNIGQDILKTMEACSDRTALISVMENVKMTFREVKEEAEILAIRLRHLGLKRGDHLGIWNLNCKQWHITWLASNLCGFPLVCINPALQPPEVAHCLKSAKVKALVTAEKFGPLNFAAILEALFAKNGRKQFPELCFVLMQGKDVCGKDFVNYDELFREPVPCNEIEQLYSDMELISPEAACNIQFTSGTTGQPKAALLSHFNLVNLAHIYGRLMHMTLDVTKKLCLPVPLFHVFGMSMAAMCLHFCNTLVIPGPFFKGDTVLDVIEKEQCSQICGTPTMFVDFIENQLKQPRNLASLEVGYIGGSTVSPKLYLKSKEVLGIKDMRIGYGQSESTSGVFVTTGTETDEEASVTCGKVCEHIEAKIIDDRGETVPFGQPGELCIRGFCVMKGYFGDEEATNKTITRDGWLNTGDEAILHPTGYMTFEGRKKNLIIRGGENIFPKEIQNFLVTHENILEAQVIGVPDERLGEEISAYLRLKQGAKPLNEADIKAFCEGKLAKYKIPKYVRIVEDFPRTATGKIQKFKLKEMFINEEAKKRDG